MPWLGHFCLAKRDSPLMDIILLSPSIKYHNHMIKHGTYMVNLTKQCTWNVGFELTMIHHTLAPCHHLVAAYKNQLACSQIGARQWCTIILHHTNPAMNLSWNMLTNCRAYQFTNKVTKPRTTSRKYQHCQDIITTWLWTCQHAYHVPNLAVDL